MTAGVEFQKQGAVLLAQSGDCSVWQFRNETGDGTMTAYELFPGVMLSFNDFHMESFDSRFTAQQQLLAIDYCREGRMEYQAAENAVSYCKAGDLKLDRRLTHQGRFVFPSSHYHGITVGLDLQMAEQSLPQQVRDFPVTPSTLLEKFRLGRYPRVFHGGELPEHIFEEMYHVPESIRLPYLKIKVLELLLYLQAMEVSPDEDTPYFYKTQVEKVKAIRTYLAGHLTENHTQAELAERFDIPLTAMKQCFRSVYGTSIGAWVTACRMDRAAQLLPRRCWRPAAGRWPPMRARWCTSRCPPASPIMPPTTFWKGCACVWWSAFSTLRWARCRTTPSARSRTSWWIRSRTSSRRWPT